MDVLAYLSAELPKYIDASSPRRYAYYYAWIRLKRFLALNIMAFSFQYLCIYHLKSAYPIFPIYPAIGIAFAVIMILGANAMTGLILGEIVAYYLKGFSLTSLSLYSAADVLTVYFGAYFCRNIFQSDIPRLAGSKVWLRFFSASLFMASLSSMVRISAIILAETKMQAWKNLFYVYVDLWLADFNAIVLFYAFLMTWLSIYMSREKISVKKITVFHIVSFIVFIVIAVLTMKKIALIYLLLTAMAVSFYFAYCYGIILATLLMYTISMLYLAYFMTHQVIFLKWLGIAGYTFVPVLLGFYITTCIMVARR